MLKLNSLRFSDSDVESVPSWVQMLLRHQDEDTSVITDFHVQLDMTRAEFEAMAISDLIEQAKPMITAKLSRTVI